MKQEEHAIKDFILIFDSSLLRNNEIKVLKNVENWLVIPKLYFLQRSEGAFGLQLQEYTLRRLLTFRETGLRISFI